MISDRAVVYPHVKLGNNCVVEDFAIIGVPHKVSGKNQLETIIGDNSIIRSHTVIYAGNVIGKNFQSGNKTNIRELNEIGDDVSIGTLSVVEHHVKIGDGVRIHSQAFVPEYTIIEDHCWVGPNVVITNAKYPNSPTAKQNLKGVIVKRQGIIGANSTLLPGVAIGEHALVGAGSVVTKDVSPRCVVAGNPARVINRVDHLDYVVSRNS